MALTKIAGGCNNEAITPQNTTTLRFAARMHDDAGFLFLNTHQDHVDMQDLHDIRVQLELADGAMTLPRGGLTIKRDTCAILPINFDLAGTRLCYATAQLVTSLDHAGRQVYIFCEPDGIAPEYCFAAASIAEISVESGLIERAGDRVYVTVNAGTEALIHVQTTAGHTATICTLTRRQALGLSKVDLWGHERLLSTDSDVLVRNGTLELESAGRPDITLSMFPAVAGDLVGPDGSLVGAADGLFTSYRLALAPRAVQVRVTEAASGRAVVELGDGLFEGLADVTLAIHYQGEVGYAFVNGALISDNFANGTAWEIALRRFESRLGDHAIELYISSLQEGTVIMSDSAMAVQQFTGRQIARIDSVETVPRYRVRIAHRPAHG